MTLCEDYRNTYPGEILGNGDPSAADFRGCFVSREGSQCRLPDRLFCEISGSVRLSSDRISGEVARRLVDIVAGVCSCEKIQILSLAAPARFRSAGLHQPCYSNLMISRSLTILELLCNKIRTLL